MSMKGYVISNETRLEIAGPVELHSKNKATLRLAFEVKIDELSTSFTEEVHKLALEIVEEVNRRLS